MNEWLRGEGQLFAWWKNFFYCFLTLYAVFRNWIRFILDFPQNLVLGNEDQSAFF